MGRQNVGRSEKEISVGDIRWFGREQWKFIVIEKIINFDGFNVGYKVISLSGPLKGKENYFSYAFSTYDKILESCLVGNVNKDLIKVLYE